MIAFGTLAELNLFFFWSSLGYTLNGRDKPPGHQNDATNILTIRSYFAGCAGMPLLIVRNFDQVPIRIEKIDRFPRPFCANRGVARPTHVADRVERISVLDPALTYSLESLVKLDARHAKRQMF